MGIMVLDVKNDKRRRKFKFDVDCCNREDHIYILTNKIMTLINITKL